RNSGEYFDVPNGNSCPMDLHDPMIRVSTIKGKRPFTTCRLRSPFEVTEDRNGGVAVHEERGAQWWSL
ncbi:hypothetical protein, partial [Streptomyces atratus]|uniref:hypothetical protein n=1 Tax=Streptomyces atratus TaxID=1893 RepID=UPI001E31DD3E